MDAETKKNPPLVCLGPKGYEKHYYPDPEKRIKTDAATIRYNVSTLLKRAGSAATRSTGEIMKNEPTNDAKSPVSVDIVDENAGALMVLSLAIQAERPTNNADVDRIIGEVLYSLSLAQVSALAHTSLTRFLPEVMELIATTEDPEGDFA